MSKRLLDRQVSLLNYLTSGAGIFGQPGRSAIDPALEGIDPGLLRIEARLSFDKRTEKIAGVLPRTFDLLGSDREPVLREFVAACPPADISRMENARQFQEFLAERPHRRPLIPPYLPDVAACELACAQARIKADHLEAATPLAGPPRPGLRRKPGVVLLRITHDVRTILENNRAGADPIRRETPLACTVSRTGESQLLELPAEVFDLLAALERWIDPAAFDQSPEWDSLISELAEAGMLEVRG